MDQGWVPDPHWVRQGLFPGNGELGLRDSQSVFVSCWWCRTITLGTIEGPSSAVNVENSRKLVCKERRFKQIHRENQSWGRREGPDLVPSSFPVLAPVPPKTWPGSSPGFVRRPSHPAFNSRSPPRPPRLLKPAASSQAGCLSGVYVCDYRAGQSMNR